MARCARPDRGRGVAAATAADNAVDQVYYISIAPTVVVLLLARLYYYLQSVYPRDIFGRYRGSHLGPKLTGRSRGLRPRSDFGTSA